MRDERRNYVIVGGFVLVSTVLLVVWLALLAGRTGATDPYYIVYGNVLGIAEGTQVHFEGYPVGRVREIAPIEREGRLRFRVDVRLRRGWRIPEDSTAQITASSFLSAFLIDIRAGHAAARVEPGGEIPSVEPVNVMSLMASAAADFGEFSDETLEPLLGTLAERTPEITENVEVLTAELRTTAERVNALLSPGNTAKIERIVENLDATAINVTRVSKELMETRARVDRVLQALDEMLDRSSGDVTHAIVDLHHSLESLAAHIDLINQNVETTTRNMSEFSEHIRQNPSLLIRGRALRDEANEGR